MNPKKLLIFTLDELRYALYLPVVEKVFRAVEITPLPRAPAIIYGVVNIQGRIIPVVNVRRRFRLPEREIELDDQMILAHTPRWTVALLADSIDGVKEFHKEDLAPARDLLPGLEYVEGVLKVPNGMVLIHDLDAFLSLDEEEKLDEAMK